MVLIVGWLIFGIFFKCSKVEVIIVFEWFVEIIVFVFFFFIKFIVMLIDVLDLCLMVVKGFLCIFIMFLVGIIFGRGFFDLWFI